MSKYTSVPVLQNGYLRIRANVDIERHGVVAGDYGGLIGDASCLSQDGDCWVGYHAHVNRRARVVGNARVADYAIITGLSVVAGDAIIGGTVVVSGEAIVTGGAIVDGVAVITGTAYLESGIVADGTIDSGPLPGERVALETYE